MASFNLPAIGAIRRGLTVEGWRDAAFAIINEPFVLIEGTMVLPNLKSRDEVNLYIFR